MPEKISISCSCCFLNNFKLQYLLMPENIYIIIFQPIFATNCVELLISSVFPSSDPLATPSKACPNCHREVSLTLLLEPLVLPRILVARTSTGLPWLSVWLCVPWLLSLHRCTGCTLRSCSYHFAVVFLVFFFCCCWTASPIFLVLESQLLCCRFYHVLLEHCSVLLEFLLLLGC